VTLIVLCPMWKEVEKSVVKLSFSSGYQPLKYTTTVSGVPDGLLLQFHLPSDLTNSDVTLRSNP